MAWLSDSTGTPNMRFTQSTVPYALVNGVEIASSYADLTAPNYPYARVELDASGNYAGAVTDNVFSNTDELGNILSTTNHCSNFTSTSGITTIGSFDSDVFWTRNYADNCDGSVYSGFHLYCFEQ